MCSGAEAKYRFPGSLLMCRWVGMTWGPERRDTKRVISVRIRHAAVWFKRRQPGSGPSGNVPVLICCGKTLSRYARGRPLEPGHARACAHKHSHTQGYLSSITTNVTRQVRAVGRARRAKSPANHVRARALEQEDAFQSKHRVNAPFFPLLSKTPSWSLSLPLETSGNSVNAFLELIAC